MEAFEVESLLNDGIMGGFFQNFRTVVPGKVVSTTGNTALIQVAIQDLDASENPIPGTINLYSVPIMMVGGASNYLTFQLSPGDYGLLLVCDRDTTAFKATQQSAAASSIGEANLEYSMFLPGLFLPSYNGVKLNSNTSILLQCGSNTSATLTPSSATIAVGSSTVQVNASSIQLSSGGASINLSSGNIELNGNVIINSDLTFGTGGNVTGNLTIDGTIESSQDILVNSISLKSHVHGGVTTGGGSTGEPE